MSSPGGRQSGGPEHGPLARKIGAWEIDCEYFIASAPEPIRGSGVETVRALGPYWIVSEARFELPGITIEGHATTGFDPVLKRYRSTWIDSATPFLYTFAGEPDADPDLLVLEGMNRDPQTGRDALYRSREMFGGRDDRIFELWVESTPGLETPILRYQYSRRK